jgi:hypothetical protein
LETGATPVLRVALVLDREDPRAGGIVGLVSELVPELATATANHEKEADVGTGKKM